MPVAILVEIAALVVTESKGRSTTKNTKITKEGHQEKGRINEFSFQKLILSPWCPWWLIISNRCDPAGKAVSVRPLNKDR